MAEVERSDSILDSLDTLVPYLVGKGAALLDLHGPAGWRKLVKPDTLNMHNGEWCVLGQIYAAEYRAAKAAYDAEFPMPPIGSVDPGVNGYHYGVQKLARLSGVRDNGVSWQKGAQACGFVACLAVEAYEVTTLDRFDYISGDMLKAAWITEIAR